MSQDKNKQWVVFLWKVHEVFSKSFPILAQYEIEMLDRMIATKEISYALQSICALKALEVDGFQVIFYHSQRNAISDLFVKLIIVVLEGPIKVVI